MDTKIIEEIMNLNLIDEKKINPMLNELMQENLRLKNLVKNQQSTIHDLYKKLEVYKYSKRINSIDNND